MGGPPARGPRGPRVDRRGPGRRRHRRGRGPPRPGRSRCRRSTTSAAWWSWAARWASTTIDAHPWLAPERDLIRTAVGRGLPVLGVCLGAQQLAAALGAEVTTGPEEEVGAGQVELTADGRRDPVFGPEYNGLSGTTVPCVHWHRDTFSLPDGAVHLAATRRFPHQAFRVGTRAYGLQFHVEVDTGLAAAWRPLLPDGVTLTDADVARVEAVGRRILRALRRGGRAGRRRSGRREPGTRRAPDRDRRRRRGGRRTGQAEAARRPPRGRLLRLARVGGVAGVGRADHVVEADLPGLRLRHLAAVRGERALPPSHLGPGRPPSDAPGRPLDHLHRHRRVLHRGGRHRPHRVGPDHGAPDRVDRRRRRDHPPPGLAGRTQVGHRPALRGGRLGGRRRPAPALPGARSDRVRAAAGRGAGLLGRGGGLRRSRSRIRCPGSSATTRCSTPAPSSGRCSTSS